jgi:hypothetical protein
MSGYKRCEMVTGNFRSRNGGTRCMKKAAGGDYCEFHAAYLAEHKPNFLASEAKRKGQSNG